MTAGSPPSTTATTEFVVPRSMPITFAMSCSLLSECLGLRRDLDRVDLDLLRLDLPGLDGNRKRKRPLELPEPALLTVVARLARLVAPLPLSLDGEQIEVM